MEICCQALLKVSVNSGLSDSVLEFLIINTIPENVCVCNEICFLNLLPDKHHSQSNAIKLV